VRALIEPTTLKLALVVALTAALLVAHYVTPVTPDSMELHELHRHLLYIPIMMAAYWYGWRGGLASAVVLGIAYFTHLLQSPHAEHLGVLAGGVNRTLEFMTLALVGGGSGWLIDRLRREQAGLLAANEQLAVQSEQLRQAVDTLTERTREVLETGEQLRRADRLSALGQLTAGLAHEIRNPLASIRGATEILGEGDVAPAQRTEFARVLVEEIDRLNHVLGNFLDYARAQRQDAPAAGRLGSVAQKVLALLAKPIADARVDARTTIPGDLPPLAIADGLLQQVLLNLALNAVQAMPRGGTLTIEGRPGQDGMVELLVADTGPGIAPERAGRIFDPFYTTKPQGTGLGLSIVHQIVAGHQGTIQVDPAGGPGARFVVRLPAAG
jgi:signal transduction histidine kinase